MCVIYVCINLRFVEDFEMSQFPLVVYNSLKLINPIGTSRPMKGSWQKGHSPFILRLGWREDEVT